MTNRARMAIGGALIGFTMVTATAMSLAAQEPPTAAGGAPMGDDAAMMQAATPDADDAQMAEMMDQMMDQCLAMMEMMSSMMGGDMAGMMGGEGMQGMTRMEDMPSVAATPGT